MICLDTLHPQITPTFQSFIFVNLKKKQTIRVHCIYYAELPLFQDIEICINIKIDRFTVSKYCKFDVKKMITRHKIITKDNP